MGVLCQHGKLLEAVLPRARRTAGNYAALFLADEDTDKTGRFYWPGLAACHIPDDHKVLMKQFWM